ncbi:hypothetical protein D3C87_2026130 [compost metagenome]
MKRNPDWTKVRNDFRGASLLAKRDSTAHEKLVSFIATLPRQPVWMKTMMKDGASAALGSDE